MYGTCQKNFREKIFFKCLSVLLSWTTSIFLFSFCLLVFLYDFRYLLLLKNSEKDLSIKMLLDVLRIGSMFSSKLLCARCRRIWHSRRRLLVMNLHQLFMLTSHSFYLNLNTGFIIEIDQKVRKFSRLDMGFFAIVGKSRVKKQLFERSLE